MKEYKIALYPGDGIGAEVTDSVVGVLEAVQKGAEAYQIEFTRFDWGVEYYAKHGIVAQEDFLEVLNPFDALFLGAVGYPDRLPDHITLAPADTVTTGLSISMLACGLPGPMRACLLPLPMQGKSTWLS